MIDSHYFQSASFRELGVLMGHLLSEGDREGFYAVAEEADRRTNEWPVVPSVPNSVWKAVVRLEYLGNYTMRRRLLSWTGHFMAPSCFYGRQSSSSSSSA